MARKPRRKGKGKPKPPVRQKRAPTRARAKASTPTPAAAAAAAPLPPAVEDFDVGSSAEQRLLIAMAGNLGATDTEIIGFAHVSRDTFYRYAKDPVFARRRRDLILRAICNQVGPVLKATVESALVLGRDGAADRKLLWEATGFLTPGAKLQVDLKMPEQPGDMADEEALWWYLYLKWPKANWLPGIRLRYETGQIKPRRPEGQLPGVPPAKE